MMDVGGIGGACFRVRFGANMKALPATFATAPRRQKQGIAGTCSVEHAVRKALVGSSIGRGVWVAPWLGPNGETLLVAVTRKGHKIAERLLSPGDDHVGAGEALWDLIEKEDPLPLMKVI